MRDCLFSIEMTSESPRRLSQLESIYACSAVYYPLSLTGIDLRVFCSVLSAISHCNRSERFLQCIIRYPWLGSIYAFSAVYYPLSLTGIDLRVFCSVLSALPHCNRSERFLQCIICYPWLESIWALCRFVAAPALRISLLSVVIYQDWSSQKRQYHQSTIQRFPSHLIRRFCLRLLKYPPQDDRSINRIRFDSRPSSTK